MQTLYFATEARFIKSRGHYYSLGGFPYSLWERYLSVFDRICIIARVLNDDEYLGSNSLLSSGDRVVFAEIPYYIGPKEYLSKISQVKSCIDKITDDEGIYLCRVPGNIGALVVKSLQKKGKNYACEVVGDPWDVCAPGTMKTPLRPFIRVVSTLKLKKIVKGSVATLYVTEKVLQKRYPTSDNKFNISASNVSLQNAFFSCDFRKLKKKDSYELVSVGSLEQMYKSPDVLLKSIVDLRSKGLNVHLTWVGGGKYLEEMRELSKTLHIQESVSFIGGVAPESVKNVLEKADLFVLVSRTEGLPRAMIEAMACALPCVGTNVGGIPELLDEQMLVKKNDVHALTNKIVEVLTDADLYEKQSESNLMKAKSYSETILMKKRKQFYDYILKNKK